jgi:hypothetical protein
MQFGTVEEHVQLVERARALLARERPSVGLGELHLEAMKLLVATLEKKKFAVTARPGKAAKEPRQRVAATDKARQPEPSAQPRQRVATPANANEPAAASRQRSRYVPAAVRREVYRRDGARCSFVDERG